MLDSVQSGVRATPDNPFFPDLPLGIVDIPFTGWNGLPLPERSRNNRLALSALEQIHSSIQALTDRFGPSRIGVIVGTSTSGISESETAFCHRINNQSFPENFHYGQQELGSLSEMIARKLGISGPCHVHSSACASGAKAIASAARLIDMNLCDAVIAGGVDTLSQFVIAGFSSLESVSQSRCNPLSVNRNGINLGEGAALFLMSKIPSAVALLGHGESSDGYHISAPDPKGNGARLAIAKALAKAGIDGNRLDYINMHGTATIQNDAMESRVIHELVGDTVPVSSTKPLTGHTLGAAGAVEAGLCWLTMQDNPDGNIPPHLWDGYVDPALPSLNIAVSGYQLGRPVRTCLSNSFAFGGSNAALVFGRD